MTRWAASLPTNTSNNTPDVLVLKCLLDGGAYVCTDAKSASCSSPALHSSSTHATSSSHTSGIGSPGTAAWL
jgi:hypothetical protein